MTVHLQQNEECIEIETHKPYLNIVMDEYR